jgi:hypothetical protein
MDDYLTAEDWVTIVETVTILEPLEEATKRLQGHGDGSSHGSIWQVIPCMEALLCHFEQLRDVYNIAPPKEARNVSLEDTLDPPLFTIDFSQNPRIRVGSKKRSTRRSQPQTNDMPTSAITGSQPPLEIPKEPEPRRDHLILCTNLNLGWAKLHKYYSLTDVSAAYTASLVLHPRYTWSYLRKKWVERQDWIRAAEQRMVNIWTPYLTMPIEDQSLQVRRTEPSSLLWNDDEFDDYPSTSKDEYTRWCRQP